MKTSVAKASGKIILFGEHFVVHGSYAIASTIDKGVYVELSPAKRVDIDFNEEIVIKGRAEKAIIEILNYLNLPKEIKVTIKTDIPRSAGLGGSAAFCVAFARALNKYFSLNFNDDKINEIAYAGEKSFHGNPSGIDNTTCNYEGLILFWKDLENEKLNYLRIVPKNKINLLIVNTGIKRSTKEMVEKAGVFKKNNPEKFREYIAEINHLVDDAKDAIIAGDLNYLGELMLINQSILEEIGVSTPEIKNIITTAINNGALGGKLTGGGGGGCVILLYENNEDKEKILKALENYECFSVTIGDDVKDILEIKSKISHLD